jgi:excisionase family DNA binding protein
MKITYKIHTVQEVADTLGLSKKTILRAIKSGELPCIKINPRVYRIHAVDASVWYLAKKACPQVAQPQATES